ncbi:MAG: DMT family transporter, partial [Clostridiaceae bacterium]|nr:DMT family transporter [Clostridiaceae bacterium]
MFNFLALLSGFIIAVVVTLNGQLTDVYANYNATFIIHLVAVVFSFIFLKLGKKKLFPSEKVPFWFYLGGAVGIFNALFQNAAFGKISLTSILALALFGQTVVSIFIDNFGWFGMEKRPFKKSSLLGFGFSIIGVLVMLDLSGGINPSAVLAIFFAFASGITTVISRSINGRLAEFSGSMSGAFINHLVGLPLTLLLALVMPGNKISLLFQRP